MRHGSFQGRRNNNRHGGRSQGHQRPQQQGNQRPHRNQIFDSNGPDVRVRGTAFQINEKYLTLAKDAASSGDLILAENYLQHAEHYQRIINEFEPANTQPRQEDGAQAEGEVTAEAGETPQAAEGESAPRPMRRERNRGPKPAAAEEGDLGLPSSLFAAPSEDDRETA